MNELFYRNIVQQCVIYTLFEILFFDSEAACTVSLRVKVYKKDLFILLTQCCSKIYRCS